MTQNVQAIYKDGVLRLLQPLDLPENQIVEIDVRDVSEKPENGDKNKFKLEVFEK